MQIRFKLRQIVPVTVYKIDADHNPLPNWTIDAVPAAATCLPSRRAKRPTSDGRECSH